jgi:hypothetical protein
MYPLIFSLVGLLFAIVALIVTISALRRARQSLHDVNSLLPTQKQIDIDTQISSLQLDLIGVVMNARVSGGTTDDMVAKARTLRDEIQELKQQRAQESD